MANIHWHSFSLQLECLQSRKNNNNNKSPSKYWWGCEEKGTPISSFVECKLVHTLCKSLWRSLKKIQSRISIWSNSGYIPKGTQVSFVTKMLHANIEQCCTMRFSLLLSVIEFLHLKKYMMGEYRSSRIIIAESLNIYFKSLGFNTD
jgi:hypothetical protein